MIYYMLITILALTAGVVTMFILMYFFFEIADRIDDWRFNR